MKLIRLAGKAAQEYRDQIAVLRIKIFREFPYLYEGDLEYEKRYLERYFSAQYSFILLIEHQGDIVGVTTAIWAQEEEASFKTPFIKVGINPERVFYFGESLLLPEWRGKGLGKMFFEEREAYAKDLSFIDTLAFASVVRPDDHPLRPAGHRPLDEFWKTMGYHKEPSLRTNYSWKDVNESQESVKPMQFWIKKLNTRNL